MIEKGKNMTATVGLIQGDDHYNNVLAALTFAYVRHPNYAGVILLGLTDGLVFGSWPSIPPPLIWIGLLVYRTLNEEKVLFAELEGYREYAEKVQYRFLPGV
jgi:protein-S-isoprenylcysteine O-methyltransferase Ste14